ncbi:putative tetratricopeptide-like helical domain superfamily, DYW domain-containing protein [Dioscorea sansibarensis]
MAISISPALSSPAPPPSSTSGAAGHGHPLLPYLDLAKSSIQLKQIHAQALKFPPHSHLLLLHSRLLHSISLSGDLLYSLRLLLHPFSPLLPTSFSFNSLIRSFSRSPSLKHLSLQLYLQMLLLSLSPDNHTFPFVLKSCAFLSSFSFGSQLHSHILKLGFSSDIYILNSLIHFYSSCARLSLARQLFDGMPLRNRVSWNIMIDGCVMCGEYETALELFRDMQSQFSPDAYTMQSALCACAALGSLSLGMWAHAFVLRKCDASVQNDVLINNSLIDLYSKCGDIVMARRVFDEMSQRDVTSWNALILGLATHGQVEDSLLAFVRMISDVDGHKLRPNSITFIGVLSACNHGGLVTEGRRYFRSMVDEFGIKPQLEHYGCMVDILSRAGLIEEALELVKNMNCKPDVVIWRSILDACCKRNAGVEFSEAVAQRALESELEATSGVYVLLSKVYASANRWNEVGLVRRLMSEEGIKKEPGCSSIEIGDGIVHEFVAGDSSHPMSKEIYEKLNEVECKLVMAGYVPDSSQAPLVAEVDGVKCESLRRHSERLAIAFGLICTKPGVTIRVLKNLRICRDCHESTKLISKLYCREIVVRDRIRFHHFRDGSCSCMDYW